MVWMNEQCAFNSGLASRKMLTKEHRDLVSHGKVFGLGVMEWSGMNPHNFLYSYMKSHWILLQSEDEPWASGRARFYILFPCWEDWPAGQTHGRFKGMHTFC
jgi:hypothetical protein